VIERAVAAGIGRIMVPGTDLESSRRAVALADAYPLVHAAVGIHPTSAGDFSAASLTELRSLAKHAKVDAIGEIGLDLYWKTVPLDKQSEAFGAQLALAVELGRPVIVHDRDAHAEVMLQLDGAGPLPGVVLHAFSGDAAMAAEAVARGYFLGVDGPLTYKNNGALRALAGQVPAECLLVETDAPYLTPQPRRGQRNEPAYVRWVAEALAQARGMSYDAIVAETTANAARLFRWELA
jgi:TatD DNase family protein